MKQTLILLLFFVFQNSYGQGQKRSEEELESFLKGFKTTDKIIIVRSGCVGCEVKYNDNSTVTDGESIYVLLHREGKFIAAKLDDIHEQRSFTIDTCSLFDFIHQNIHTLQVKETFYKNEIPKIRSKNGFYPPRPIHYSYERLNIHLQGFNFEGKVIDNDKDHFGLNRRQERWFILTREIIQRVYSYFNQ